MRISGFQNTYQIKKENDYQDNDPLNLTNLEILTENDINGLLKNNNS